jgi:hypothetical protein
MRCTLILVLVVSASLAFAQNGFVTTIPDEPVEFSQIGDYSAWVQGHWVPVNPRDRKSEMLGPSISQISCDHSIKVCYEKQANIVVKGDMFTLTSDFVEYAVERWNKTEIVASTVQGICRVRNVIKFDRVNSKVYWMQTVSEPLNDLPKKEQDDCNDAHLYLELKASTMWKK